MRQRVTLSLIAFLIVIVVLVGVRYQWARAHRTGRMAISTAEDSLRRDTTRGERDPVDTLCLASRLGLPCDQH